MSRVRALLLVVIAACSRGAPPSLDEYFEAVQSFDRAQRICQGIAPAYATVKAANSFVRYQDFLQSVRRAVSAGRVKFDPLSARSCLEGLALDPKTCWGPQSRPGSLLDVSVDSLY